MIRCVSLSFALLAATALSACNPGGSNAPDSPHTSTGSGASTTQSYQLSGFTGVEVAGPDDVVITRGERFAVVATGDREDLDRLRIRVSGDTLEIGRRSNIAWGRGDGVTIRVTMPALTKIALAGSGDVTADALTGNAGDLSLAGSGDLSVTGVDTRSLELSLAGSGNIAASGRTVSVDASIAGSGDIDSPSLTTVDADISIAGSGNVRMTATGAADISSLGSGDVTLTGGATCTSSKMGSGSTNCS